MESRIKAIRNSADLNQAEMAERIGVTVASISAYETGIRKPSSTTIAVICDKFGINEEWLRKGTGKMKRETPETIVNDLAKAYSLSPVVAQLLNVIAQAFVELDDESAERIMKRLRDALAMNEEQAIHSRLVSQIDAIEAAENTTQDNQA